MNTTQHMRIWYQTVQYGLASLLFFAFIRPIMFLTDQTNVSIFMLFVLGAFVLHLIRCPQILDAIIKGTYLIGALLWLFYDEPWTLQSLRALGVQISQDVPMLFTRGIDNVSDAFLAFLFMILLWMMTYLVKYWIEVRQNMLFFYVMIILFLIVVDLFTAYTSNLSLLIVIGAGVLLLGFLSYERIIQQYQLLFSRKQFQVFFFPFVIGITLLLGVLAYAMHYHDAAQKDMTQKQQGNQSEEMEQPHAKSGYHPDDSQLGGPFLEDDSLVFQVTAPRDQHWKVETKDTYTSKGWEQTDIGQNIQQYESNKEIHTPSTSDAVVEEANFDMAHLFPFIIRPYRELAIHPNEAQEDISIAYQQQNEQYYAEQKGKNVELSGYTVVFEEPKYSLTALKHTRLEKLQLAKEEQRFLQLPEQLPRRVTSLATSITKEHASMYDKAKAIEQYLREEPYVYERYDVRVPEQNEDFVDQFLFETQQGYCDHFSTSMVVMLRSAGIPARWVKGFAPGKVVDSGDVSNVYEVTNNDAHSWVEAYMPGVGWMPFEPTPGFQLNVQLTYDLGEDEETESEADTESDLEEDDKTPGQEEPTEETQSDEQQESLPVKDSQSFWKWSVIFVIISCFIMMIAYVTRQKWLHIYLLRRYTKERGEWAQFEQQYQVLLQHLNRMDMKRSPDETLTLYAKRIDEKYEVTFMGELTKIYERGIYGDDREIDNWQRLQQLWVMMIKVVSR